MASGLLALSPYSRTPPAANRGGSAVRQIAFRLRTSHSSVGDCCGLASTGSCPVGVQGFVRGIDSAYSGVAVNAPMPEPLLERTL